MRITWQVEKVLNQANPPGNDWFDLVSSFPRLMPSGMIVTSSGNGNGQIRSPAWPVDLSSLEGGGTILTGFTWSMQVQ